MRLGKIETKQLKKISQIGMHDQCLLYKPLGMKSWNLERAAKAFKTLLKKVHAGECPKGHELLVHIILVDLGRDCVDVHSEVLKGRWVRISYTVYSKKK